jgi:hypothetical protein
MTEAATMSSKERAANVRPALPSAAHPDATDELVALGRQNGAVIADYVVAGIRAGKISPADGISVLKAYIAKRVNEVAATALGREKMKPWTEAVECAFDERLAELAGPDESETEEAKSATG